MTRLEMKLHIHRGSHKAAGEVAEAIVISLVIISVVMVTLMRNLFHQKSSSNLCSLVNGLVDKDTNIANANSSSNNNKDSKEEGINSSRKTQSLQF